MKDPRILGAVAILVAIVVIKLVVALWPEQMADLNTSTLPLSQVKLGQS